MDTIASPFKFKTYDNYDAYLEHQKSKLNNGISWLENYEKHYETLLKDLLKKVVLINQNCLCLGARGGAEVRAFLEYGCFCIGIDVNPGTDNRYVVTGDASDIQFPDNCLDIVYTNCLDHFLRMEKTFEEIKRVLRPWGRFIFLVPAESDTKNDEYGSTWWDDTSEILKYISEKYNLPVEQRIKVKDSMWFTDFVVMVNG